jgi:hypothetical protein
MLVVLMLQSAGWAGTLAELLCPRDPHVRAGHPQQTHRWAKPTVTPHYSFDYVGGGAVMGGHPRTLDEGTWGMDYCGHYLRRRVWLNWHGRALQGSSGRYATDGPHILKKK